MITKSGIDSTNFEFKSSSVLNEKLKEINPKEIPTKLYALKNKNGMEVCITNVGARIVSLMAPDKNGHFHDVVLGYDKLIGYIDPAQNFNNFHGAVVGRFANRIKNAEFEIDGKTYKLPKNDGENCLHGGPLNWAFKTFEEVEFDKDKARLTLKITSPDGEMGFPGNVEFFVTYYLRKDNSLHIDYKATTDAPTVINVTNHTYWNLSGDHSDKALMHRLFVCSHKITAIDEETCPTGEVININSGGAFDFFGESLLGPKYMVHGKRLRDDIKATDTQIQRGNGYDHNFIILPPGKVGVFGPKPYGGKIPYCAKLSNDLTDIKMDVYTSEPGVLLYDGVNLDGSTIGKNGIPIDSCCGICLETGHYPNSPNIEDFPSTILRPGEEYNSTTIYNFS